LFIVWLGIYETSKITLIAVGVFFPVYLNLMSGIQNVDRKLVEVGRMYRLSGFRLVRRVLLPATLPSYLVGLRGGLGLGWMFVVAAEFMGASKGLANCCFSPSNRVLAAGRPSRPSCSRCSAS
jgi:sulfonate transport system permease protein